MSLAWHPTENILCFANTDGEVFIYTDFVPPEHLPLLKKTLQPAPFIHDPLKEVSANAGKPLANGFHDEMPARNKRHRTPDSLDDILGPDGMDEEEGDFIIDDDGAGYAENINGHGKRPSAGLDEPGAPPGKRRAIGDLWRPRLREPFQPGSTPWRGNRRYLCKLVPGIS